MWVFPYNKENDDCMFNGGEMKKWMFPSILAFGVMFLAAACTGDPGNTAQCPTITIATACPFVPTPTPAPSPIPFASSLLPYTAVSVKVNVESLNLRNGPGTIFSIRSTYSKDVILWVYAKEPGDNWLFVRYFPDIFGWVDARFVTSVPDLSQIPAIIPSNVFAISGKVLDQNGNPAQYIQFAVMQGSGNTAPRTDAQTNADGWFHAYLPDNQAGTWTVAMVAYGCGYAFAGNCDRSGTIFPETQTVILPPSGIPLEFIWDGN
jgi:hypothetical protein